MRILVVHNRYRPTAPSGENGVVDQETAALRALGHEVELFQRHSGEIESWSLPRKATLPARTIWSQESRRALAAELARFRPDVVHVHNTFPLLTGSVLRACRDAGVPLVASIHNYKLACASGELFRAGQVCHDCLGGSGLPALAHGCYRGSRLATLPIALARPVHRKAWQTLVSAYIFVSGAQRDLLDPLGLPPERRFVKHNFVPVPDPSDPADPLGSGQSEPVRTQHAVAFVGRLDPAKGAPFLMAAWDAFRAQRPSSPLRLTIAGGGPLQDEVSRWAADRASVTFAGYLQRAQVPRFLASARAVLLPSQWEETFGLVAVEAMAVGTAPIASGHGSFPELITPGVDGALFPQADTGALVDLLASVDDDPQRWDGYGQAGRRTYLTRFTPQANVDRLIDIYEFAVKYPAGSANPPPPSTKRELGESSEQSRRI